MCAWSPPPFPSPASRPRTVQDRAAPAIRCAPKSIALWGAPYRHAAADGPLHLLVFGGSQGARAFSEIVPAAVDPPARMHLKARLVDRAAMPPRRPGDGARRSMPMRTSAPNWQPFFTDLPQRMAEAHLVIARSGAGTVAELMAIGRPAILVPLPARAGRQPDAQCRRPGRGRRRLARGADAISTPEMLGADADRDFRRARRSGAARRRAHMRWPSPMPRNAWPIWSSN